MKKKAKYCTTKMEEWLENKISMLKSDANKLKQFKEKKLRNKKTVEYFIKKYHLETRKIKEALEIIK